MEPLGGCGQGQEARPVKEPEHAHIKEEPETWDCQYEDLVKEEAWCVDEVCQEPSSSEKVGSCSVSLAAMLAGLYANHTIKDELVLGPELPHRPTVTPVFRGWSLADIDRGREQLEKWSARLERVLQREGTPETHSDTEQDVLPRLGETERAEARRSSADGAIGVDAATGVVMGEMDLCVCCLQCPPDKGLTMLYAHHDKREIYSDMLKDCFNVCVKNTLMVLDGWVSCGICFTCVGRLRDACDFKLQVQRCLAELCARTPARSRVKEEEPDRELSADHEEETGYVSRVLQELPGPGLADGAGASDDAAEPAVRSKAPAAAARDEERPQQESPVTLERIPADEAELFGAASAVSLRARRQLAAACAVRLERLRAPHKPARRASAPHTYACDMCTQRFYSKYLLIRHIGTHYRCEVCDKTFMMSDCLTQHKRNCTENKEKERKLANKNTLSKSHAEVVLYYCDECGKGFNRKIFLSKHIQRSHTVRQVLINSHSRLFKRQVSLTQKKPFHCSQCVFKSSTKSLLQIHQRIHTGEKPFKCGYCDFKCSQKSNLQKHHQRIHTREKPFKCDYCDFKSSQKANLQKHQRTHTGEKPFKCGYCDFKCSQKSNLQTHQKTHTGEKPFKCGYCDFKCSQKSNLQKHHQRIHTREKPFKCDYCDFKSSQKANLQKHQRTHRRETD